MSQSLSSATMHVIFSTKDRKPFLGDEDLRHRLHAFIAETGNQIGCPSVKVGGPTDHIHILCELGRTTTIADLVKEQKRISSKWLKRQDASLAGFAWQKGYGAFSVGLSSRSDVIAYIGNQVEHHRRKTFKEEYRRFLDRHGIEYDERYVWD